MLLVIGITGHTGRFFLNELIKNNYKEKIRFFVRNKEIENTLKKSKLNYEIFLGDLKNENDIDNACKNVDTVLEIYNIHYSLSVLNAAINNNVKRIIFVHTTGIYSKYKEAKKK